MLNDRIDGDSAWGEVGFNQSAVEAYARLARITASSGLGPSYLAKVLFVGLSIAYSKSFAFRRWSISDGITFRAAVCGPASTVVWQGRDQWATAGPMPIKRSLHKISGCVISPRLPA